MIKAFMRKGVSILMLTLMFTPALPSERNAPDERVNTFMQSSKAAVTHSKHFPKLADCGFEPRGKSLPEAKVQESLWEPYNFISLDHELQEQIYSLCNECECEYNLILAVIKTESEFDIEAVGDNGNSIGLMQIQPRWWQGLADENDLNIYEPVDNAHLGIIILDMFIKENNGDLSKALKQYNSGNPDYKGNEYTDKVFLNYEWLKEQVNETT